MMVALMRMVMARVTMVIVSDGNDDGGGGDHKGETPILCRSRASSPQEACTDTEWVQGVRGFWELVDGQSVKRGRHGGIMSDIMSDIM